MVLSLEGMLAWICRASNPLITWRVIFFLLIYSYKSFFEHPLVDTLNPRVNISERILRETYPFTDVSGSWSDTLISLFRLSYCICGAFVKVTEPSVFVYEGMSFDWNDLVSNCSYVATPIGVPGLPFNNQPTVDCFKSKYLCATAFTSSAVILSNIDWRVWTSNASPLAIASLISAATPRVPIILFVQLFLIYCLARFNGSSIFWVLHNSTISNTIFSASSNASCVPILVVAHILNRYGSFIRCHWAITSCNLFELFSLKGVANDCGPFDIIWDNAFNVIASLCNPLGALNDIHINAQFVGWWTVTRLCPNWGGSTVYMSGTGKAGFWILPNDWSTISITSCGSKLPTKQ